ncbi:helix-turn-helix domain-containing protein [Ekhidna sp. To15]|uniref:helix-turn-helix domain-containing protein n=1 Tax=Ekhidna sp. To15 TaxID=3395267 RepID=UPI003F52823A
MNLEEAYPKHPLVGRFIDRYQFYNIEKTTFLKSIPNGKIESWVINNGSCQLWDDNLQKFNENKQSGFYPASNSTAFFKIEGGFKCLNIKWKLNALALPFFRRFQSDWLDFSLEEFVGKDSFSELSHFYNPSGEGIEVSRLDEIFEKAISRHKIDARVSQMVNIILTNFPNGFKVPDLASYMCVSRKTLERQIKNHLGLFPKELSNILRFSNTTNYHLTQQGQLFFTDSIKFGYYDQSHFIKECKKVTGYTPTEFFSKLKFSTNDLIIENDNLTLKT